eukprot:9475685-Pyramimonas_sp.AAC.2
MCVWCDVCAAQDDKALRFCFDVYDADANGWLSKDEMGAMVSMLATGDDEGGALQVGHRAHAERRA